MTQPNLKLVTPSGHIERDGNRETASKSTRELVSQAWDAKRRMEEAKADLDRLNAAILKRLDDGDAVVLPGLCRCTVSGRETVKVSDAGALHGALGNRFSDLVEEAISYKPTDKLKDLAADADDPLSAQVRAALTISTSRVVQFRAAPAEVA